jgi:hypothetical protein
MNYYIFEGPSNTEGQNPRLRYWENREVITCSSVALLSSRFFNSDECVGIERLFRIISHVKTITFFIPRIYKSIVTIGSNKSTKFRLQLQ